MSLDGYLFQPATNGRRNELTNAQLLLAILVPTITVLVGIMLNHSGNGRLEARLISIEGDLRRFYQTLGEHSARLDNIEKK